MDGERAIGLCADVAVFAEDLAIDGIRFAVDGLFYLSEHFLDLGEFERRDNEIVFVGMKLHARKARLVHIPKLAVNLDEVAFSAGARYSRFIVRGLGKLGEHLGAHLLRRGRRANIVAFEGLLIVAIEERRATRHERRVVFLPINLDAHGFVGKIAIVGRHRAFRDDARGKLLLKIDGVAAFIGRVCCMFLDRMQIVRRDRADERGDALDEVAVEPCRFFCLRRQ